MKIQTLLSRMESKGVKVTHEEFKKGEYIFYEDSELIRNAPNGKRTVARIKGGLLYSNGWSVLKEEKEKKTVTIKSVAKKKKTTKKKKVA